MNRWNFFRLQLERLLQDDLRPLSVGLELVGSSSGCYEGSGMSIEHFPEEEEGNQVVKLT